jgi:hypothetical protein
MQTSIDIARDAGHATPCGKASSTYPVDNYLSTNAAYNLPLQDTRRRGQASSSGQWVSGQKFIYRPNLG